MRQLYKMVKHNLPTNCVSVIYHIWGWHLRGQVCVYVLNQWAQTGLEKHFRNYMLFEILKHVSKAVKVFSLHGFTIISCLKANRILETMQEIFLTATRAEAFQ